MDAAPALAKDCPVIRAGGVVAGRPRDGRRRV